MAVAQRKWSRERVEGTKSAKNASSQLGSRLRRAREAKGMTLRAMARAIGVSPGLVSQIELGTVTPSVGTLYNMASQLGIVLDDLFVDSTARKQQRLRKGTQLGGVRYDAVDLIQRPGRRDVINLAGGVTWERLTAGADTDLDFLMVVYEPGAESCPKDALTRHPAKAYVYEMSGRLGIRLGFEEMELAPGESMSFDAQIPHRFWTIGKERAVSLWSVLHYKPEDPGPHRPPWPPSAQALKKLK
jgi:transcriptional regulator with XRE-family HTH domain